MKKLARIAGLIVASSFVCAQATAQIAELDISNQIELPSCSLDIKLKIKRQLASRDWQAQGVNSVGKVGLLKITLNGKKVALPADIWTAQIVEANRIKPPFRSIGCGFALDVGDASESGQVLIAIEKGKLAWIEQWDSHGRRLSKTVFDYPKAIVLN